MGKLTDIVRLLFLSLALIFPLTAFSDSDADETVSKRGVVDDDYYAAGGVIDIDAEVSGDVVVAGGELFIGRRIEGDVMAAGGAVKIRGEVEDDVRISGGDLYIDAAIGDDLAASGGSITVSPASIIGGEAWLAGGEVHMAGTVNKDLKITAGNIRLSGTVHGDVELEGGEIQILEGTRIDGKLNYKSPEESNIDPAADIAGEVSYEKLEWDYSPKGFSILFSFTLVIAAILLFWLFPKFTLSSADRISSKPWKSLGVGIVLLIVTPIVAVLLMLVVFGVWIGLTVLAIYFIALLLGYLIACFFLGDRGARLMKQELNSRGARILSVTLAILLLGFLQIIPIIGGLVLFVLLLAGLGGGVLQLHSVYRESDGAASGPV